MRNESLWRIKDAEELIKSRVTQVSIDTQIKALKNQFEKDMSNSKHAFNQLLKSEVNRVTSNVDVLVDHSEQKYGDAKAMC
jgi:pantothenate kinase-related protein Tda10